MLEFRFSDYPEWTKRLEERISKGEIIEIKLETKEKIPTAIRVRRDNKEQPLNKYR